MSSFVELQNAEDTESNTYQLKQNNYENKCIRFFRNRIVISAFVLIVFSLTVPVLLFFILFHIGYSAEEQYHTCLVENFYRVPCGKINITAEDCNAVKCCFDEETEQCYHYIPSLYYYYQTTNGSYYAKEDKTPFNTTSTKRIAIDVIELDENKLKIVLHHTNSSFNTQSTVNTTSKSYEYKIHDEDYLYVEVVRRSNGDSLFTTHKGPLIVSAGYWEWTFQLTTENLFGLGQISFAKNTTYKKVIYKNRDDHNTLPVFMAFLNGSYHGAVVEHEGPLEVTVLPSYLIILRGLVGDSLNVTVTTGPTPADVVKQQRISRALDVPFWALGPHICRKAGDNLLEALTLYYEFLENEGDFVEYATDCIHENLVFMLQNADETTKKEVAKIVTNIKEKSRFMVSFQPQIDYFDSNPLYEAAVQYDLLYKDNNNHSRPLNGSYKNKEVVFVDFSLDGAKNYFNVLHNTVLQGIVYDGVTLTDNWPAEDTYIMYRDNGFPFLSESLNKSLSKTIPWNSTSSDGNHHIYKHNSYATPQIKLFKEKLSEEAFLMTSAYDYNMPAVALIQDIDISWNSLRESIETILYHSLFTNSLISIPICGTTANYDVETHESICIRWYIVAATSPLFRISSKLPLRDPQHLTTGYARNVALKAIKERGKLLLYFYTVLKSEEPLMRPLFYDFYDDNNTLSINTQYMVGPAIMVAQILLPKVNTVSLYFPKKVGVWYEYFGGSNYTDELGWRLFSVVETDWLMFIRQGYIIPLINGNNAISLAIALNCTVKNMCYSTGTLQYGLSNVITLLADTDGIIIMNANNAINDIVCTSATVQWPTIIESAVIYGLSENLVEIDFSPVNLCDIQDDKYVIIY